MEVVEGGYADERVCRKVQVEEPRRSTSGGQLAGKEGVDGSERE